MGLVYAAQGIMSFRYDHFGATYFVAGRFLHWSFRGDSVLFDSSVI